MAWSSVPFRSQKVMPSSTAKPLDLVEHRASGVASGVSLRCTLPGITMRTGGGCFSMVRICTGEVCVRSSRRSRCGRFSCPAMKMVSWVSRAGWFGGKFSASKL